ncbi:heavy metal translocating P-type ATPase [Facklamia sp. 7083-14-GEN3]|uniref:heavy metal translocating P-type ATPase n=1 Tax=Facklamia sp. 7083-14-GEN3 TaxID=2973478 RepID=UPI00215B9449|nr:heavy metal translocating P-type ATPase [Facklamia sp. 7083-14-GEN3]MCR8969618.1 heavy metal translocating P-type ATPase [Facklamia sp. 7083-14-GEN3]
MSYKFKMQDLNCANCAQKIETRLNHLDNVEAIVNFAQGQLTIETDQEVNPPLVNSWEKIVQEIEEGVALIPLFDMDGYQRPELASSNSDKKVIDQEGWRILITIPLFLFGFLLTNSISSQWLLVTYFALTYLFIGQEVLKTTWNKIKNKDWLEENFLMTIATLGAFAIGEYPEAVAVMLFYSIGEWFQDRAVEQSRQSIQSLMAIRPDFARVKQSDGSLSKVDPRNLLEGQEFVVAVGDKVPLDGQIIDGHSQVDHSAITGESLPQTLTVDDTIYSGSINLSSQLTVKVTKTFQHSTVSQIIDLVENASSKKAATEKFITRFSRIYTPIVVGLAVLLAILPPFFFNGITWSNSFYRALQFLVISCPCALVISVPMSFYGGIGAAAREGIMIKGGNFLETLTKVKILVLDKTGTITQGNFAIDQVHTLYLSKGQFLEKLAHLESQSHHPIALSIQEAYGQSLDPKRVQSVETISGKGLKGVVDGQSLLTGNKDLMDQHQISVPSLKTAATVVYLSIDQEYQGYVLIKDQMKTDSKSALKELHQLGISSTILLSGDNQATVDEIADLVGIDQAKGNLLPQEKMTELETILTNVQQSAPNNKASKVAFIGDGINDAPALARADIGIAMGAMGSDAAIESADIVIMNDSLAKLPRAIKIAQKTLHIAQQNILFALGVKVLFLVLATFGYSSMWMAIVADVGVTILAVLNSLRTLNQAK